MIRMRGRPQRRHDLPEFKAVSLKWDPAEEVVQVQECMLWIKSPNDCLLSLEEMKPWLQMGHKKLVIEDETQFCDENVVSNIFRTKMIVHTINDKEIRYARARCNPYETIRRAFFLNRSAIKMANLDKACDFMFTRPEGLQNNELLYFADVCAGPGGFSEYVLWRKKWHAKGFGFTLKDKDDFELDRFHPGTCETLHPYYGPKETGDVCDPINQEAFRELIMTHTHGKGVHFMMSDGAFPIDGQEHLQEILYKQLYLCQCLVALMVVREKGHFVTNLFDVFTPFSAGVVYLMYHCFEEICIMKPNSSRPANSERFLICKSKKPGTEDVIRYLKHVNDLLLKRDDDNDVLQLVSFDELQKDNRFLQYLRTSNERIAKKQIVHLRKLAAFCRDSTLVERKQDYLRKECLKYWEIPDTCVIIREYMNLKDNLHALIGDDINFVFTAFEQLTSKNIKNTILTDLYDWFCMPCSSILSTSPRERCAFYMGMGRSNVYRLVQDTSWMLVDDIKVELPPKTLVFAEVVDEIMKESTQQQVPAALHILDAFVLGGENISNRCFKDRIELTKLFCEALWKPAGSGYACIRVKELLPVDPSIRETLKIKSRTMKDGRLALVHEFLTTDLDNISDNDKPYFPVNSIIFVKNTPVDFKAGNYRVVWYSPYDTTLPVENIAQLIEEKRST